MLRFYTQQSIGVAGKIYCTSEYDVKSHFNNPFQQQEAADKMSLKSVVSELVRYMNSFSEHYLVI